MSEIGAIALVVRQLFVQNYPTITETASRRRGEIGIFGTLG